MIRPARILFTLIGLIICALILYYKFYDFYSAGVGKARYIIERVSRRAINPDYAVSIARVEGENAVPVLPDISSYTFENIAALAPPFRPGKVEFVNIPDMPDLGKFMKGDSGRGLRLAQLEITPKAIAITQGDYDFVHLYEEAKSLAPDLIEKINGDYIVRYPLLVGAGASLTISGADASKILLAQDRGVFVANSGNLFILKADIAGWNEKENKQAFFKEDHEFRPFIVSWSGAKLYIAGSKLASLGFDSNKAHGISYSSCPICLRKNPNLAAPTGAIIDSFFTDIYYGFYSYEAEDIAIIDNIYADNIIYGIDPHDRSKRLIIAKNNSYGARKKHGIIISREVNDSWIFDNEAHDNHGSGIMLDRKSVRNIVARNIARHNGSDGITFFESSDNITYDNQLSGNADNGIHIRNSENITSISDQIIDNGGAPISISTAKLEAIQKTRDFKRDPYVMRAGATIDAAIIQTKSAKPAVKIDGANSLTLTNLKLISGGPAFAPNFFADQTDITANIDDPKKAAIISKKRD